MKKAKIFILLFALIAAAAVFCFANRDLFLKDELAKAKVRGYLTVGVPYEADDCWVLREGEHLSGFDIEAVGAVLEEMGLEARFVEVDEADLISGLSDGSFSLAIGKQTLESIPSDRVICSIPYAYFVQEVPDPQTKYLDRCITEEICILIANNGSNAALKSAVDMAICNAQKSAVLAEISEKYFEKDITSGALPSGAAGTADDSKAYIYQSHPNLTPVNYNSPALLCNSRDMGLENFQDKMVFLCDSPTYWMKPFGLLSGGKTTTQIWTGPEGTQTFPYYKGYELLDPYDGQRRLMVDMAALHQPEIIVLCLGVNGIGGRSEESFTGIYEEMVLDLKSASPDSLIICSAIYPITPAYKHWDKIDNDVITRGNSWILNVCEKTGCYYFDAFSALLGEDGNAIPEYMKKDGLHPNKEGLQIILEYFRTHACVK